MTSTAILGEQTSSIGVTLGRKSVTALIGGQEGKANGTTNLVFLLCCLPQKCCGVELLGLTKQPQSDLVILMNPLLAQQTVVVYRSKAEQMQDEAAMKFMEDHPDAVLYGFYGFGLLVGGFILYTFCKVMGSHFRSKNNLYRRH